MDYARQLEWELSLSGSELISHGWYRGPMGRAAAEAELPLEGSFLVRDSASQPGNYVLSCRHSGQFLHFVINRVVIQPETVYERFQYQFEDEPYDTVPDLVTSYVGSGKPISMASGARIQKPSNRTYPLSCYTYNQNADKVRTPDTGSQYRHFPSNFNSLERNRDVIHNTAMGVNREEPSYEINNAVGYSQNELSTSNSTIMSTVGALQPFKIKSAESDEEGNNNPNYLSKTENGSSWEGWESVEGSPPAKPARGQQPGYQTSGSDSGNGSGDSHSSGLNDPSTQPNNTRNITKTIKPYIHLQYVEEILLKVKTIEYNQISNISCDSTSVLFSSNNNKPLESDTLHTIKSLLRTSGPRILANHMTTIDMRLILGEKCNILGENNNPLESVCGMELILLPHGQRMRMDLLERIKCLKFLIAVTILTCQTDAERADVLNDWIQLAIEVKTALGNLFAFSAIMLGLCMPQIECLEAMWLKLRQKHTDAAFTFEAKLRPCFKSMNDCCDPVPPNTTIPHLMPTVILLHNSESGSTLVSPESELTTNNTVDFGLSIVAAHLEMTRKFLDQIPTFRQNARTVVQEMSSLGPVFDPMLLELFQTEFHIRFLWGSRGALVSSSERHSRLSQVLTAMSQKYPSQTSAE